LFCLDVDLNNFLTSFEYVKPKKKLKIFHNNLFVFFTKKTKQKQFIETWIFYTKFIPRDGHQMVNTNILTLSDFAILYSRCYFQTYKVCLIITIKIRGKIQQKMHYKIYIYAQLLFL